MQWGLDLLSVGYIIMVTRYFWAITGSLSNIGEQFNTASEHLSNAMEMLDIFDESIEVQDPPHPEPCRITGGSITFNGVDFTYEMEGKEVFQGLNLTVPAGQRVGIVGPSGSGKSTLMKLLLRFADPEKGTISIDGQDIARITQASLREHITYVPQDPMLFHRSLAENIRYGDPNASDEQLAEAARLAHASSFIDVLPEGYATLVGERGVKLSGGERQRVAIARAMLKQAPLLLLDEATSALDTQSERYIQDALETLMRGRTTVVVAHRLSTIMQMDRIIVMDKGQIVEDGPHEALLAAGGLYATLWEHQTDGFLAEDPQQS
ncbi:ABC transporter ATP-binding protein [Candidatus Peribacteria bacterium]|nr:ABC transporter ATP-binding protein [Candidatus Peribacteria bacterium]